MGFFNWKILILFERTKDLSINSASLLLSMSKRICIPAMLVLNTRCLPSILATLFYITYVDILIHLSVVLIALLTTSFVHSLWWWFLPGTTFFAIPLMTRVFCAWYSLLVWHSAFSSHLYLSYLDIQGLLHSDLNHDNSSSVFALTMSHG